MGPVDPNDFIPAIGQGALAIESRPDEALALLQRIEHRPSRLAVEAERAFLLRVGGSCVTPLAAHAVLDGETVKMRGLIAQPDGTRVVRGECSGPAEARERLGTSLADELLARGGAEILRALEMAQQRG
jgi:hydroxymethylbilane synthase